MIVTISGDPGSGKSLVISRLKENLSAPLICVGQVMRDMAKDRGMSLLEFHKIAAKDLSMDKDIDDQAAYKARELNKSESIVLVDGRTQFYFLPESLKLYIGVSPEIGAQRI